MVNRPTDQCIHLGEEGGGWWWWEQGPLCELFGETGSVSLALGHVHS